MAQPDCPNCRAVQHVPDQATAYKCQNCGTDVVFLTCSACGVSNGVVSSWSSFVCRNCGRTMGAGSRADRVAGGLESAGDFLSNAGSTVMWLVVVVVMIFGFKACGVF